MSEYIFEVRKPNRTNTKIKPTMWNAFEWVKESVIDNALQNNTNNQCKTCKQYSKGFIINAGQWISCFECNKENTKQKSNIERLEERKATIRYQIKVAQDEQTKQHLQLTLKILNSSNIKKLASFDFNTKNGGKN